VIDTCGLGTTSQNELFAFDVTADGAGLTNLRTGQINQSCTPPDYYISGNYLNFDGYRANIAADGSFSIPFSGNSTVGSDPSKVTGLITGHFSGAIASGTLVYVTSWDHQGTHYDCSSGNQTWSATRTS